ncbi:MAG: hypothetical protein QF535_02365 [Anaerolineales bacterium]|nr:hypothetical protein [Anaerolineales bacterium]
MMLEFVNPENYFPVDGLVGKTLTFYTPINTDETSNAKIHYYEQYTMFTIEHNAEIPELTYFGLKISSLPLIMNPTGNALRYKFRYTDNSEWKYDGTS